MAGKTISEKTLSAKSGVDARAGRVVVCAVDCAMGAGPSIQHPLIGGFGLRFGGVRMFRVDSQPAAGVRPIA